MPEPSDLPNPYPLTPLPGPIDFEGPVPGSKSLTNRALVLAALADGEVWLDGALVADDTRHMLACLRALGFSTETEAGGTRVRVSGLGGRIPATKAELFTGNAGTVMRFLTTFCALGSGTFRLDGVKRMRERPIQDLLDALQRLGVDARSELDNRCPPVVVHASGLPGGLVRVDGGMSSQYISSLLMAAPYARAPLAIEVTGDFVSRPYVDLTLDIMAQFGVGVSTEGARVFRPTHGARYHAGRYALEGDATAASYFLAAAAILGGRAAVTNVRSGSQQGDVAFAEDLRRMGCQVRLGYRDGDWGLEVRRDPSEPLRGISVDLNDRPDVAQTLAVVALFAEGKTTMINIGNLRIKETDRLKALATELPKLGAEVEEGPDYLEITPGPHRPARIETYDDHRMAMSFALAGLARPGVSIADPGCVAKTYPGYFDDLRKLRPAK